MSKPIITVDHLGKAYHVGKRLDKHQTLRDALSGLAQNVGTRFRQRFQEAGQADDAFWAIRNVSFDVNRGEVLGLVGRNGAGKSTLLKVLSRITEPTEGRAILRGRVASLLEVGPAFTRSSRGARTSFSTAPSSGCARPRSTGSSTRSSRSARSKNFSTRR